MRCEVLVLAANREIMGTRQIIFLLIGIAAIGFAGVRIAKLFGRSDAEKKAAVIYRQTWRCRADGYETNLAPEEVSQLFTADKWRLDPTNMSVKLFACPKCGKIELEQIGERVDQRAMR